MVDVINSAMFTYSHVISHVTSASKAPNHGLKFGTNLCTS
jgi:hypothetical protein